MGSHLALHPQHSLLLVLTYTSGSGISIGIATDDGLDGPSSKPGGNEIFRPSTPALGLTQPPVQWVPGFFPGVEAAGPWG